MSKREFVTGTPMPLGHRRATVNQDEKAQQDEAFALLAAKVLEKAMPAIAEAVAEQLKEAGIEPKGPTTNGSNGRKIADAYQPPSDDHWQSYDLNEPIGDEPPRFTPTDAYELPD